MVRLKKNLNEKEIIEVLDKVKANLDDMKIGKRFSENLLKKTTEITSTALAKQVKKVAETLLPEEGKKQPVGIIKRIDQDQAFDPNDVNLTTGEVRFANLGELIEASKKLKQSNGSLKFQQYTNPVSQLVGYDCGNGQKHVISMVDLRKDIRADSFTFSPLKFLEG